MPELIDFAFLVAIVIIVFGARRLPALGEAIGRRIHGVPKPPDESHR